MVQLEINKTALDPERYITLLMRQRYLTSPDIPVLNATGLSGLLLPLLPELDQEQLPCVSSFLKCTWCDKFPVFGFR